MQEWFEYEFGYVNIDAINIYLTRTGNWSETSKLTEKCKKSKTKNDLRSIRMQVFFGAVILLLLFITFGGNNINLSIIGVLSSLLFGYKVYQYLQHDMGSTYKIPRSKIKNIVVDNNEIRIDFTNGDGILDSEILANTNKKGVLIIEGLLAIN